MKLEEKTYKTELEKDLLVTISAVATLNTLSSKWLVDIDGTWARSVNEYANELFFIYLIDLISPIEISKGKNLLESLLNICEHNIIPINNNNLEFELNNFNGWLNGKLFKNIYFSAINKEISLNISVRDMIYLVGNINKHHPLRLQKVVQKIKKCNETLSEKDIMSSLSSLSEDIKDSLLGEKFPLIVKFLVDIYNSLCTSLYQEFNSYYRKDENLSYHYEKPDYINTKEEFSLFNELMDLTGKYKFIYLKIDEVISKDLMN